jgi:hypothetical protein
VVSTKGRQDNDDTVGVFFFMVVVLFKGNLAALGDGRRARAASVALYSFSLPRRRPFVTSASAQITSPSPTSSSPKIAPQDARGTAAKKGKPIFNQRGIGGEVPKATVEEKSQGRCYQRPLFLTWCV